jgi:hypothetical protein
MEQDTARTEHEGGKQSKTVREQVYEESRKYSSHIGEIVF